MFRSERLLQSVIAVLAILWSSSAHAADPPRGKDRVKDPASAPAPAAESQSTQQARAEFITATEHVKNARWGEALAAFERSAELRPHALTTFNIGACERALGRYTRAQDTLNRSLAADGARHELAASFVNDAKEWIREIDAILVHATVVLKPADAALLVDGSPLTAAAAPAGNSPAEYVVGLAHPGASTTAKTTTSTSSATPLPGGRAAIVIDPGVHIFSVSRGGFASSLVTKTLTPGSKPEIVIDMQSLPAMLHVASNLPGSVVSIDDLDVGVAPIQVTRPAGAYAVVVRRAGFVTYQSRVKVGPGEEPTIQATLLEEKTPVTKKVWFWSAAAALVAGAVVGTYFLTRPDPERPAPNGGALGWVVTVPVSGR